MLYEKPKYCKTVKGVLDLATLYRIRKESLSVKGPLNRDFNELGQRVMWQEPYWCGKANHMEASVDGAGQVRDVQRPADGNAVRLVDSYLPGFCGSLLGLFRTLSMSWHISQSPSRKQMFE